MSFSNLDENIVANIISLDERLKRYSYGPPVASMQQMLALIDADILNLNYVDNPEISIFDTGWQFVSKNGKTEVNMIINSVLDPAELLKVNSSLVKHLLKKSMVKPVHGKLGIQTKRNACVELPNEAEAIPLAVLGPFIKRYHSRGRCRSSML